jgi:hypothetical protein
METEWMTIPHEEQKFMRGNLVHIAKDLGPHMSHFTNDVDAIIIGSYRDLYGGSSVGGYSVIFPDDGSAVSWYEEDQLTFIDQGGEHLIIEAQKIADARTKQITDLGWVVSNWNEECQNFSPATILFLFEKIGHETSFLRNGEYALLYSDWWGVLPFFDLLMKFSREIEVTTVLTTYKIPEHYIPKFVALFHEIQAVKNEKPKQE